MERIAIIGFGEAGQAFAAPGMRAFDIADKGDAFTRTGVDRADTLAAALSGATAVLSLVTADQSLAAAAVAAPLLERGAFYFDMNSVGPATKRAAADAIDAVGGRYVDVAVMSPVHPARRAAPLLLSGRHTNDAAASLGKIGFTDVRVVPGAIGRAASIKMIRSVMVKGVEALTAECVLAAEAAGVLDEVLASLDASSPPFGWRERADYNLDRMMVHGTRRAAEMEEVVRMLESLKVEPALTRGTALRQRRIGTLRLTPPTGLSSKLAALRPYLNAGAA